MNPSDSQNRRQTAGNNPGPSASSETPDVLGVIPLTAMLRGFTAEQAGDIRALLEAVTNPFRGELLEVLTELRHMRNRMDVAESAIAHIEQQLVELKPTTSGRTIDTLNRDVRQLRADINTLLESNGNTVAQSRINTLESRLYAVERIVNPPLEPETGASISRERPHEVESHIVGTPSVTINMESRAPPNRESSVKDSRKDKKAKRKNRKGSGSSSEDSEHSSDEDSDSDSEGSITSEDSDESPENKDERGGVFVRKRRPAFQKLKVIRPSNRDYRKLLDYRYYRLKDRRQKRTGYATKKVKKQTSKLEVTLKDRKFDGSDKIKVLTFLAEFAEEADLLRMSEGQASLALKSFLKGSARTRYEAANGIGSWAESVQYFLVIYATDAVIEEALSDSCDIRQRPNEAEVDYSTRLSEAELRCGNVNKWDVRKLRFIDGLLPSIKPLVARYNRMKRDATYWDVIEEAQSQGEAFRARGQKKTELLSAGKSSATGRGRVYMLEQSDTTSTRPRSRTEGDDAGDLHLISDDQSAGTNLTSPTWTSTTSTSALETIDATREDPVLLAEKRVRPSGIPFSDSYTRFARPGWVNNRDSGGKSQIGIYCHACYKAGHISPDCTADVDTDTICSNYERLPREVLRVVPATNYWRARDHIDEREENLARTSQPPRQSEVHPRVHQKTQPQAGPSGASSEASPQDQGKG